MTADPNQSRGRDGRPLVLRSIPPGRRAVEVSLRDRKAGLVGRDEVWELIDPWAFHEGATAALAVTRRVGGMVILLEATVHDDAPPDTVRCLVQQLVAVLRRTDASLVCTSVDDAVLLEEFLAAGFVALPEEPETGAPGTPADRIRFILQL